MPAYSLNVVFITDEENPVTTCEQVANILNSIPENIGVIDSAVLHSDNGTTVDLKNVPVPRPPAPLTASAQTVASVTPSVAPPASGPQSVDPDNPPEHSLPTGKEF